MEPSNCSKREGPVGPRGVEVCGWLLLLLLRSGVASGVVLLLGSADVASGTAAVAVVAALQWLPPFLVLVLVVFPRVLATSLVIVVPCREAQRRFQSTRRPPRVSRI